MDTLPMLAHDYTKRGKDIRFPCFVQPKLDGVRTLFRVTSGFTSRTGKPFLCLQHIGQELSAVLAAAGEPDLVIDGELYSDTLTFQEVVGLVKKQSVTAKDQARLSQVHLWVYDCVGAQPYRDRLARLQTIFANQACNYVHLLETDVCADAGNVPRYHATYVEHGYEGLMLRNADAPYECGSRSKHLQKYKHFQDAEFPVVGFTDGTGGDTGLVIWKCETDEGLPFQVRPRGTHAERAQWFAEAASFVGKRLTVRFQERTTAGIPRFPVGIAFRDDE